MKKLLLLLLTACLLNGCAKSSYDAQAKEILADAQSRFDRLEKDLENTSTQNEMCDVADERYRVWEDALNRIYEILENSLPADELKALETDQKNWFEKKEKSVQEAGDTDEGGSMALLDSIELNSSLTRERAYELAEKMNIQ